MLKIILKSFTNELKVSLRIKQSLFFSIVFPILLFTIFSILINNEDTNIIVYYFSSILVMNIASDGMFAIGGTINHYLNSNFLKYLKTLPFNFLFHFFGLILNRLFIIQIVFFILIILSFFLNNNIPTLFQFIKYEIGILIGFPLFSFLGLIISNFKIKNSNDDGLTMTFYYILLFISDAFFPLSMLSNYIKYALYLNPLTFLLNFLRNDDAFYLNIFILLFYIVILYFILKYLLNKKQFAKKN